MKDRPYVCFFVGDFNAHSLNWWSGGDTNAEGFEFDNLISSLDLFQLISESTNFEENKLPSCIDLIICDQSNVAMESGVRPSPDNFCKHQITFCNLNLHIPPPIYSRKIWYYNRANADDIKRAVSHFPWLKHLTNLDPSQQLEIFNDKLLNIMMNFIPNRYVKIQPKDPPWINNNLRRMIKSKINNTKIIFKMATSLRLKLKSINLEMIASKSLILLKGAILIIWV